MTGFKKARIVKLIILSLEAEVFIVIDIDLDDVNEVAIYEASTLMGMNPRL